MEQAKGAAMLKGFIIRFLIRQKRAKSPAADIITFRQAKNVLILLQARDLDEFITALPPEIQTSQTDKKIGFAVFYPDNRQKHKPNIQDRFIHLPVSRADFNLIGLPRKSLRKRMEDFQADLVLSLDAEHEKHLILASTLNHKAFRVGPGKADPLSGFDLSLYSNGDNHPATLFAQQCKYLISLNGNTNES